MSLRPTCSYLKCWNHFGFTEPGTDVLNTVSEQTGRFMWCICGVKRRPCFVSSSISNSDILWYFHLVCSSIFRSYLLPPRCSFWKARSGWTGVVWSDKAAEISTVALKLGRISTVVVEAAYRCLGWWSDCRCSPAVSPDFIFCPWGQRGRFWWDGAESAEDYYRDQYNSLLQRHLREYSTER